MTNKFHGYEITKNGITLIGENKNIPNETITMYCTFQKGNSDAGLFVWNKVILDDRDNTNKFMFSNVNSFYLKSNLIEKSNPLFYESKDSLIKNLLQSDYIKIEYVVELEALCFSSLQKEYKNGFKRYYRQILDSKNTNDITEYNPFILLTESLFKNLYFNKNITMQDNVYIEDKEKYGKHTSVKLSII